MPHELPDSDALFAALAAGEIPADDAARIRASAAADPGLAARLAAAERLEAALCADGLLPLPLAALSSVLDAVRREAPHAVTSGRPALVRAAAAALAIALGAHLAFGGGDAGAALAAVRELPIPRALAPDLGVVSSDAESRSPWRTVGEWQTVGDAVPRLSGAESLVPGSPGVLLGTGAGLLAVGVLVAARRRGASKIGRD